MPSKFAGHTPDGMRDTCTDGCRQKALMTIHTERCAARHREKELLAACEEMREALRAIRIDSEEWEDRFDGKTAAMSAISDSARAALALADRVLGEEEER